MVVARVALVTWLGSLFAGVAHPQGVTTVGSVDSSGNPGNDASGSGVMDDVRFDQPRQRSDRCRRLTDSLWREGILAAADDVRLRRPAARRS